MNFRKSLFGLVAVVAVAVLAVPVSVQADAGAIPLSLTNSLSPQSAPAANLGSAAKVDDNELVDFVLTFQGDRAATDNITVTLARSHDGTLWDTRHRLSIAVPLNGNTAVTLYTNLASWVGAASYVKITTISNAAASCTATNVSAYIQKKRVKGG